MERNSRKNTKRSSSLHTKNKKEFETIDDDIAKLEEKIEQLDEEIMENATNSGKLAELRSKKKRQKKLE